MTEKFSFMEFLRSLTIPHPARDWLVSLVLLIALFVSLAGYAGYIFWGIQTGAIAGTAAVREIQSKVTRNDITTTLEAYRVRRVTFEEQNFQLPALSDPARN